MNDLNLLIIGGVGFLLFSILSSIIYYVLKKKWGLYEQPRSYYSSVHKKLHWSIVGIGIVGIVSLAIYNFSYQSISPVALLLIWLIIFPANEILRVYMQKKYGEDPKWMYLSLYNFAVTIVILVMIMVFIQAIY